MSIVRNGDVWGAFLANQSLTPILDGNTDIPGHGEKLIDDHLDDRPDQIKNRFYNWFDNLKVSIGQGLIVNVNPGIIVLNSGKVEINGTQLSVPSQSSRFIIVNSSGSLAIVTAIPNISIALARVVTDENVVTLIEDLRPPLGYSMNTYAVPSANVFRAGDVKYTLRTSVDPGWLKCDGQFLDPSNFLDLFNAIGYTFGQQGNLFRLPPGDLYLSGGGNYGEIVGSNQGNLSENNLPPHNHVANQIPHSHQIIDPGHNHGNINITHGHGITQSPHGHGITQSPHRHPIEPSVAQSNPIAFPGYGSGSGNQGLNSLVNNPNGPNTFPGNANISVNPNSINLEVQPSTISASIPNRQTGIQIEPATVSFSTQSAGNGQPFDNRPRTLSLNLWIKT